MRNWATFLVLVAACAAGSSSIGFAQAKGDELPADVQAAIDAAKKADAAGNFAKAGAQWAAAMKLAGGRFKGNPKMREAYYEAYFAYGRTMYHFSQTAKVKDANNDKRYLDFAANHFVKLQFASSREGWDQIGPRVLKLADENPPLKAAYEKLRDEREKAQRK